MGYCLETWRLFWVLPAVPLVCCMLWSVFGVILDFPLSQGSFSECFLMYYTCTHTAAEAEPHLLDDQMALVGSASHSHDLNPALVSSVWQVYPGSTGEDYNPDGNGYPGSKAGNLYSGSFWPGMCSDEDRTNLALHHLKFSFECFCAFFYLYCKLYFV